MYHYDVFISYRRNKFEHLWLTQHFLPAFEFFLENAFPGDHNPKLFFDQLHVDQTIQKGMLAEGGGIEPGTPWRRELERAIQGSRCMVGLWSLPYFRSKWCQVEWRSFANRSGDPLVVASLHERKNFPGEARAVQMIDLSDFTMLGNPLSEGRLDKPFRDAMRQLAEHVANRVLAVGEWREWPLAQEEEPVPRQVVPLPNFSGAAGG